MTLGTPFVGKELVPTVRFKRGFVHFLYLLGVNVTRYGSISSFVSWIIHYVI